MVSKLSGYVPFYNNSTTVLESVESLCRQESVLDEVFSVDDGSTDGGASLLEAAGVRVLRQRKNLGRGAVRALAMTETRNEFVVCCDATNVLGSNFVSSCLHWFDDPKVAAVFGRIEDPKPKGVIGRWRARHLFKIGHRMEVRHHAPLITYGTIVRRSAVMEVGNYASTLRHSEDAELGERLLAAGYDIVFDPSAPVYSNVQNTLFQVLERYWRWYAGKDENISWRGYCRNIGYAVKGMAWQDLRAGDPLAALISLISPHFQFWHTALRLT
jgi:cellulose synthase/poly-beta-1,6-N-acetylglucosamine synthase-like glycosyltransferase